MPEKSFFLLYWMKLGQEQNQKAVNIQKGKNHQGAGALFGQNCRLMRRNIQKCEIKRK